MTMKPRSQKDKISQKAIPLVTDLQKKTHLLYLGARSSDFPIVESDDESTPPQSPDIPAPTIPELDNDAPATTQHPGISDFCMVEEKPIPSKEPNLGEHGLRIPIPDFPIVDSDDDKPAESPSLDENSLRKRGPAGQGPSHPTNPRPCTYGDLYRADLPEVKRICKEVYQNVTLFPLIC